MSWLDNTEYTLTKSECKYMNLQPEKVSRCRSRPKPRNTDHIELADSTDSTDYHKTQRILVC
jgi:hypothetical protein